MIVTNRPHRRKRSSGPLVPLSGLTSCAQRKVQFLLDSKLERDSSNDSNVIDTPIGTYLAYNHDSLGSQR